MSKRDDANLKAWRILEGQISLLRSGTRATDYACRHVLDLPVSCDAKDVCRALHRKIHLWLRMQDVSEELPTLLGYVTAAKQLLAVLKGK